LQLLEKVSQEVRSIPNRRKESKRRVHYGLFLLGYKSGLRVSEAIKFDLANKTSKGLYRISKPKGKKERLRELNISKSIELSPHTLRRTFATYQAEASLPLPLLQKLLGHSSIRTTALYWRNIYGEDDPIDILVGKKWLENREKEPPKITVGNSPEKPSANLEPIIRDEPQIPTKKPIQHNISPLFTEIKDKPIANYQPKSIISGISIPSISPETEISEPLPIITNQREQKNHQENILLAKIRKLEAENNNLKALVQSERKSNQSLKETITNLTHKFHTDEQNHTNLLNAYQKAFNDKARAEKQVNYYESQLKTIAKKQEQEAQIEQSLPFKRSDDKKLMESLSKKILMATKSTPEEVNRKKEYVRFLNTQIYKLANQHKYLTKQLAKLEKQLKDYQKEKEKTEKWLKEN
ncbi:16570_t:CDS:2, partial [Funneliformis geosporum]